MTNKRILYLTPGLFDKGGISRYGRYQTAALAEILGDGAIEILSVRGPSEDDFEEPVRVNWHGDGPNFRSKVQLAWRTLARAITTRPDIIWSAHVNFAGLTLLAAHLSGARPVLNVYGLEVWSRKRWDAEYGLRNMPTVVSDCYATARHLVHGGWQGDRMFVVWDCVNVTRFSPGNPDAIALARYGLDAADSRFRVLMLGRISEAARHKGWDRLVDVAEQIGDKDKFIFVLAGDGDYREALKGKIESRGLSGVFHFTGSVSEQDLVEVYRFCDVFTLVSDRGEGRGEGIPLTPLEAAACGKVIIVGNQDGSREAVEAGVSGFCINPFNVLEHAGIIERLAAEPEWSLAIGMAARKRIVDHHSFEQFVASTEQIIARVCGDSRD